MQKKIYRGLDVLKYILALMIFFLHINPFPADGVFYSLSKAIANIGVPSFFMISGFLFYNKVQNINQKDLLKELGKCEQRLLKLLGIWLVLYFLIYDLWWIIDGDISTNVLKYLHNIMFGGSEFFLWYVVAQMFATALFTILLLRLRYSHVAIIAVILVLVGMIGTSYLSCFQGTVIETFCNEYCKLFTTFRNGLFFGFPCVFIGTMISKYQSKIPSLKNAIILEFIAVALFLMEFVWLNKTHHIMQVTVLVLAVTTVLLFMHLNFGKIKNTVVLRELSFLIYMIHPLLIRLVSVFFKAPIPYVHYFEYYWYLFYPMQIPTLAIISIIIGVCIIKISKKIRFFKYLY